MRRGLAGIRSRDALDLRAARRKLADDKAAGRLDAELERAKAASRYSATAVLERLRAAMPQSTPPGAAQAGTA